MRHKPLHMRVKGLHPEIGVERLGGEGEGGEGGEGGRLVTGKIQYIVIVVSFLDCVV